MKSDWELANLDKLIRYKSRASEPYVRPMDWLTLPTLSEGQERAVVLFAVNDATTNRCALQCSGNYTVDWGDGVVENFATGVTAQHSYDFTTIPAGTLCSRGYKQVICSITPQAGSNFTSLNFGPASTGIAVSGGTSLILDMAVVGALISTLTFSDAKPRLMEQFVFIGPNVVSSFAGMFTSCISLQNIPLLDTAKGTSFTSMFYNCTALQTIPLLNTALGTDFSQMFSSCSSLHTIPLLNTALGTNFYRMFSSCSSLHTIPLLNTALGTTFSSMFSSCYSLQTIPLLNTALGTNFSSTFSSCYSLQTITLLNTAKGTYFSEMFSSCISLQNIPLLDTAKGTSFTSMFSNCTALQTIPLLNTALGLNFSGMFQYCTSLQTIPLLNTALGLNFSSMLYNCYSLVRSSIVGTQINISYANCFLSKEALVEIFTNLASGVTGQTITVTGNYGAALLTASDRLIATDKGWTISG